MDVKSKPNAAECGFPFWLPEEIQSTKSEVRKRLFSLMPRLELARGFIHSFTDTPSLSESHESHESRESRESRE
jgi:hypothetical protein